MSRKSKQKHTLIYLGVYPANTPKKGKSQKQPVKECQWSVEVRSVYGSHTLSWFITLLQFRF